MINKKVKNITGGIVVTMAVVVSALFISDKAEDFVENKRDESRARYLVERVESGTLTYDEYLELVDLYDAEIQKSILRDEDFIIKDIDKDNPLYSQLNDRIIK